MNILANENYAHNLKTQKGDIDINMKVYNKGYRASKTRTII